MKYMISKEYGCVYWVESNEVHWTPLYKDGTFDTDEGGAVERPHDEVPESYYQNVIATLGGEV